MAIAYTRTPTTISVVLAFRPYVIPSSHPNFKKIGELVAKPSTTEADLKPLLDIPAAISTFTGGNVTVVDGRLFYKGFEVKNNLAQVILGFVKSGQPESAKPFEAFLEKSFQNPDPRAVEGLYDWVVAGGLPITPEGDILAWKIVANDYFSKHSGPKGRLRHQIGDVVEEERSYTDSDPNRTCSKGIHFCSIEYIENGSYGHFGRGDRVMAVTISPTDVVAFPNDYNLSKGRCCKLTVVGEVEHTQVRGFYPDGQKVYSGWTAPAPKHTRFPVQIGDVWKTKDGRTVTVDRFHGDAAYLTDKEGRSVGAIFTDDGTTHRVEEKRKGYDLVELISEGSKFIVGDQWVDNDGDIWEITKVTKDGVEAKLRTLDGRKVDLNTSDEFDSEGNSTPNSNVTLVRKAS